MRGKLLFVTGAAVGYVLGARAGRKRYEQIKSAAMKVWETPGIQKQVNAVEDLAAEKFGELPGAIFEGARKVVTQVVSRAQNSSGTQVRPARPSTTVVATPPASVEEASATPEPVKPAAKPAAKAATKPTTKPAAKKPAAGTTKTPAAKKPVVDEADDAGA